MVDVSAKQVTVRKATARALINLSRELALIKKGDPIATSRLAGIMAAKKTSALIPLCHPLPLDYVDLNISIKQKQVRLECVVKTAARTGVEMEALVGVNVAALTFYDMIKSADKAAIIANCGLYRKSGGKSGIYVNRQLNW